MFAWLLQARLKVAVVVVRMQLVIIRTVLKIGFDQKIICSWGVHSVQQRAAGGGRHDPRYLRPSQWDLN